jgi:hypothetical protein
MVLRLRNTALKMETLKFARLILRADPFEALGSGGGLRPSN